MKKPFNFSTPTFSALESLAVVAQNNNLFDIKSDLVALKDNPAFVNKSAWIKGINKSIRMIESGFDYVPFKVYAKGNSKLPFYSFSVLPGVSCPGAGECLSFCYSPKAWRYPSAYFRQLQNTLLMRFNFREIMKCTLSIPNGSTVRLYVDGDFSNESDISKWFHCMREFPELSFYGYSKSLELIADYARNNKMPINYKLNLSSGHNADSATVEFIKTLPIYRGEFIAVNIGFKVKGKDYGTAKVNNEIHSRFTEKVFPCPGKCGNCTSIGHACGSAKFNGKIIAIAVH